MAADWTNRVERLLDYLPPEFTLADAYRFIPVLQAQAPANHHVPEQLRKQLQELVHRGTLERLERGTYRQNAERSTGIDWPLHPGQQVSRPEVAEILHRPNYAIPRGMFRPNSGPAKAHMVLFSNLSTNPYGDRRDGERFIYTGEHGAKEGHLDGFNKYLANHAADGTTVHLFTNIPGEDGLHRYEGEVVVESWREVYRHEKQRKYFEFTLMPVTRGTLGKELRETYEASLEFHLAQRKTVETTATRIIRDRAFREVVVPAYDWKCAVCGPVGRHGSSVDIQAAHILAVCDDGPDTPTNGIALCARHHWGFDHGIYSLTDDLEIVLWDGYDDPHRELRHGAPVRRPSVADWQPLPEFIGLHRRKWGFTT